MWFEYVRKMGVWLIGSVDIYIYIYIYIHARHAMPSPYKLHISAKALDNLN